MNILDDALTNYYNNVNISFARIVFKNNQKLPVDYGIKLEDKTGGNYFNASYIHILYDSDTFQLWTVQNVGKWLLNVLVRVGIKYQW